jgi:hypothetical protein
MGGGGGGVKGKRPDFFLLRTGLRNSISWKLGYFNDKIIEQEYLTCESEKMTYVQYFRKETFLISHCFSVYVLRNAILKMHVTSSAGVTVTVHNNAALI